MDWTKTLRTGFYGLNYFYCQTILSTVRGGHRLIMIMTTTDGPARLVAISLNFINLAFIEPV